MLYPKIKRTSRGNLDFQWRSTRTGFRFGSNSFLRWLRYPFTRVAWNSRAIYRKQVSVCKTKQPEVETCPCGNPASCTGINDGIPGCEECCGHSGDGSEACRMLEMTPEEADAAYEDAQPIPISDEEVERLVGIAVGENCRGCGEQLLSENAWMEDGCPCNSPRGVNS